MHIGLTYQELLIVFAEAYKQRTKEAKVELLTSDMGLNPSLKQETDRIFKQFGIKDTQSVANTVLISAILDTIEKNNESISNYISSLR